MEALEDLIHKSAHLSKAADAIVSADLFVTFKYFSAVV